MNTRVFLPAGLHRGMTVSFRVPKSHREKQGKSGLAEADLLNHSFCHTSILVRARFGKIRRAAREQDQGKRTCSERKWQNVFSKITQKIFPNAQQYSPNDRQWW
jgi:hypothetical protein